MLQGKSIAVVIPAYNESQRVTDTLESVPSYVDRILLVDDGSDDHTGDVAASSGDKRLAVLRHPFNRGVGGAILTGYCAAREAGLQIAVVMAGDGQMHPDDMPTLLVPILRGEADYVKGNRLAWPNAERIIPTSRRIGIKALEVFTRVSTGLHGLSDFQCGYTALKLSILDRIRLDQVYPRYGFPNDFLNHLVLARARIAERVVRPVYEGQRSDLRISKVIVPILVTLLRGTVRRGLLETGVLEAQGPRGTSAAKPPFATPVKSEEALPD